MTPQQLESAQTATAHTFADPMHLQRSLTHASCATTRRESNERMEFLGDAVLGLVCCQLIYHLYPDLLEGEMTKIKSSVVSRPTCASLARHLGLDRLLVLGKGMQGQRELPQSLAAGTFESVLCAIYLDAGLGKAREFLIPLLSPLIHKAAQSGHQENFKSVLQQHAQHHLGSSPSYVILDEKGPDHSKCFEVAVEIAGRRFPSVWGASKKQAEQQAAFAALDALGLMIREDSGEIRVATPGSDSDSRPGREA